MVIQLSEKSFPGEVAKVAGDGHDQFCYSIIDPGAATAAEGETPIEKKSSAHLDGLHPDVGRLHMNVFISFKNLVSIRNIIWKKEKYHLPNLVSLASLVGHNHLSTSEPLELMSFL